MNEEIMEVKILGQRRELDRFLAYAAENAHRFATVERFTAHGRLTTDPNRVSYEVGTVDRPSLMKAYVQHVHNQSEAA
jgi:hypothetical protein